MYIYIFPYIFVYIYVLLMYISKNTMFNTKTLVKRENIYVCVCAINIAHYLLASLKQIYIYDL